MHGGQLVSATLNRRVFQDILQPLVPGEFSFFVCLNLEDILEQVHTRRQHLIALEALILNF